MINGTARKWSILLALLLAAFLSAAAACGSSSDDESDGDDVGATSTAPPAATDGPSESSDDPSETMDPMDGPSGDDGPPSSISLSAVDNVFRDIQPSQASAGTIEAPANTELTVSLLNDGVLPHNIAFFDKEGGKVLDDGEANGPILLEAESGSVTFMTPDPGSYYFNCTVHPTEMFGEFIVK